jgi:hypothetical protein
MTASSIRYVSTVERDVQAGNSNAEEVAGRADVDPGGEVLAFPSPVARPETEEVRERPLREVLGDVLRDERHAQERTLAEVAADAFVSLAYLSEVERGRKEPSSEVLASICAALAIPLADVLDRSADRLRARSQRHGGIQLLAS